MSSPCKIACWTGAAPRQAGSSEKCRFTQPLIGTASVARGQQGPVRDHGATIRTQLDELFEKVRVARARRGQDANACLDRQQFDGRGDLTTPAPGARMRAGNHTDDFMPRRFE